MRHTLAALAATILLAFGLACSGMDFDISAVPPPGPEYVGAWEGPGITVTIEPDGQIEVHRRDGADTRVNMPAKVWTDDAVEIGVGPLSTRYEIQEAPYQKDGTWIMVFDGVQVTRAATGQPPLPELNDEVPE